MAFNVIIETKLIHLVESLLKQLLPDNKKMLIDLNAGKVLKCLHWYHTNSFKHPYKQICFLIFPLPFIE